MYTYSVEWDPVFKKIVATLTLGEHVHSNKRHRNYANILGPHATFEMRSCSCDTKLGNICVGDHKGERELIL